MHVCTKKDHSLVTSTLTRNNSEIFLRDSIKEDFMRTQQFESTLSLTCAGSLIRSSSITCSVYQKSSLTKVKFGRTLFTILVANLFNLCVHLFLIENF